MQDVVPRVVALLSTTACHVYRAAVESWFSPYVDGVDGQYEEGKQDDGWRLEVQIPAIFFFDSSFDSCDSRLIEGMWHFTSFHTAVLDQHRHNTVLASYKEMQLFGEKQIATADEAEAVAATAV